jgi:parallel beta-helix repeat protein
MNRILSGGKVLLGSTLAAALLFSGCGSSENFVITNSNNLAAPVAANDAFNALGNATVNQAATGVLANDAVNGAGISAFDAVGSQGGSVALNADGSFAYTPVVGFVGAETFTYTLSNNSGASTATVTMTSTGLGYFVDNTAAPGGNGSQASPFDTLAPAIAAANPGDTIFVARGDGTNTGLAGAVNLPPGVDLIGEGTGLILAQVIVPQGLAPTLTGPINCGGTNTVSGLFIDGSGTDGVNINGVGDVTVSNNTIGNPTEEHIDCLNVTGMVTIDGNTLQNPPNIDTFFIGIANINTNGDVAVTNNTFTNAGNSIVNECVSLGGVGTSVMNVQISGNVANGTVADQLDGFTVLASNTSQVTVTVQDNTINNCEGQGITVGVGDSGATMDATISGNTVSNSSASGLVLVSDGTVIAQNNIITNAADSGILVGTPFDGLTLVLTNNNITNCGLAAVNILGTNDAAVAARDNTMTGSGVYSFAALASQPANLCFEVTGNTVDDDMFIDTANAAANIDLENGAAGLETVNTFAPGTMPIINQTATGTVTNRAAGFCQIP